MLLVFACVTAFLLAPAASQSMVKVGFYGEALCPDCIAFINGPLTIAFREVCWCALIRNQEFLYLYIIIMPVPYSVSYTVYFTYCTGSQYLPAPLCTMG